MSTRYMKKVYGGGGLPEKDNESESDVENSIIGNVKSKAFNVFDVLDQNSENEQASSQSENEDGREKENKNEIEEKKKNEGKIKEECVVEESYTDVGKRKKKKKRQKRSEGAQMPGNIDPKEDENIDEIDRTVREVNKLLGELLPGSSSENADNTHWKELKCKEDTLMVQHKHLNPYNELKRIFGSKTVQAEQSNKRGRGRTVRKTWIATTKDNWPPITKASISMTFDQSMECAGNVQYFMYEHSPAYRQIQMKFLEAVESLNPENIVNIINAHSFHVDALLQLAELCKVSEDLAMAAEFTERAMYCLECSFHPLFNITTARCRLDYRKQQNRALFITLFKHLGFIGGRACYRTSLELCKVLLSFDPEGDPLAVVLCLDFYALRAKEYEWFVEFCDLWESTRNLTQLPNIAYSLALAYFHLGNRAFADKLLQDALIMFPGVLLPLLQKCGIQSSGEVMNHDFFTSKATASTPSALEKLQNLYVARSFYFWRETDILPWLEQAVNVVLTRVDSNKDDYIKYCDVKRSKRYQGKLPKNILRHIILSDLKEVTVNLQETQGDGAVLSHDPLPPVDSIDIYKKPVAHTRTTRSSSNLLSLFFSSLFTDVNGEVAVAAADGLNLFYDNNEQA